MPLPKMPIRADRRPADRDDGTGSDYDPARGWWRPTPPTPPTPPTDKK